MSTDPQYRAHDHMRFFLFEQMGGCADLLCVGGPCLSDLSKMVYGMSSLSELEACTVYSIGGNNKWSFEDDILQKTNCQVPTLDCTGLIERFSASNTSDRLHFHHIYLGAERAADALVKGR